jgi:hypothetical protein
MPVTTAAVTTSRRARRARRNECSSYHLPSSQGTQPRSHSELANPAAQRHNTRGSSGGKAQGGSSSPDHCAAAKKNLRVVTVEGIVSSVMEEGEAQTLAMTTANPPPASGSRTMSASSSNESSPTSTRAPGLGDESPQGIERSFKRRRSFSKLTHSSVWTSTIVLELIRVRLALKGNFGGIFGACVYVPCFLQDGMHLCYNFLVGWYQQLGLLTLCACLR